MQYKLVEVNKENYHLFDDMIYWRINGKERTDNEKKENTDNQIAPTELYNTNFHVFAIEINNKFVAWISIIYLPKVGKANCNGFIYVDELWVEESHRRLGLAKELMKKADELCIRLNTVGIRLGVNVNNPSALNLYEDCGYISTGQAYTMEKRM